MRQLTFKRRLTYAVLTPVIKLILRFLWLTCRVERIMGENNIVELVAEKTPCLPCYWHQHHLFGAWYMRKLIKQGAKIGFLVSPSVDGEVPARLARSWGGVVIRGSTTRAGALAMREMYETVVKKRVSPVTTSDGPQGPPHKFKLGDVMLSQFTQAPLVPLAYAASRAWQLSSWDRFIVPKPFSRIVISIGKPCYVPKGTKADELEPIRQQMEDALNDLAEQAANALHSG